MKILGLVIVLLLIGCDPLTVRGGHTKSSKYEELCINGVVYYTIVHNTIVHSAFPAFKPDGTLYLCNGVTNEKY